jgi:DNA-binding beta-propeller fold protein YncE
MPGHRFSVATLATAGTLVLSAALGAEPGAGYRVVEGWPESPGSVKFGQVAGVATDAADRVFVFHRGEPPVVVFDRQGRHLRSWGEGLVKKAHGLRIDHEQNVWTTDVGHHLVRKFDHEGKLLLTLGQVDRPGAGRDRFNQPTDVAVAPSGAFYVADGYGNARVVQFSKEGTYVKEWGQKGQGPGEFHLPHAIVLDPEGRVYVGDRENDRVQVFDPEGRFLAQWPKGGAPYGLFLAPDHRLFVADGRGSRVTVLDRDGQPLTRWGEPGSGPGQFAMPHAVCVDSHGDVYVGEVDGKRIQKFSKR